MASSDGQGYLIPENPTPEEMACILVFYPDDPFYLRALLGSLSYLGTWTAWERDISKRGRLAASAWKEANECTYDSMGCLTELVAALSGINTTLAAIQAAIENQEISLDSTDLVAAITGVQVAIENQEIALDTGLLLPALTGIQTAIENQEMVCNCGAGGSGEMGTVNVYCGCGCGNSGGNGYEEPPELENGDDYPDTPPFVDDPNYNPLLPNATMCEVSHGMLMDWRNLTLSIVEGKLRIGDLYERLKRLYYGTVPYLSSMTTVLILWQWFFTYTGDDKDRIFSEIDSNYDRLQCAILQGGGTKAINDRLKAIIKSMDLGLYLRYQMQGTITMIPWESLFLQNTQDTMKSRIGDGYAARGCPTCSGGIATPAPYEEGGYEYIWVIPDPSKIVFTSMNKVTGIADAEGKITITKNSDSSYDHGCAYEFIGIAPVGGVMVASEIETLSYHPIIQWGVSQIGSYAGNSSDGCPADVLQKRIQITTGDWSANGKIRTWADLYYPGKVDTQVPTMSPMGWPSFIQPNAIPLQFRVRYLYKVPSS